MRHRYLHMSNDKQIDEIGAKLEAQRAELEARLSARISTMEEEQPSINDVLAAATMRNEATIYKAKAAESARQEMPSVPRQEIIKFMKTGKGSPLMPTQGHIGDAGWDLYSSRPVRIEPGSFVDVPCDICMELPPGYWARITGRSSTIRKYGLMVAEGVIDNGYRGELFTGVWNLGKEVAVIPVHSRLAQLILHPLIDALWMEVASLGQSTRGTAGFGSTGKGA